jgi:glyoxylase-like metal-dependent hydrolase (beta-lactamase superfamily II)
MRACSGLSLFAGLRVCAFVFAACVAVQPANAQTAKVPGELRTEQVRGDLYQIRGEGGNVALLVTDEGALLVDSMFHRNHDRLLEQVAAVSAQPISHVINTHQHDDHAGGNFLMLPIAEVIAHRNVLLNLSDIQQPYYEDTPGAPIGLPRITFRDALTISLGEHEVHVLYFGRGHTNADAVVYFPNIGVIHAGDLFPSLGTNIYVDYAQGGSLIDWSATLDAVLELDFDLVITGHGPVYSKAELAEFRDALVAMRNRIAELIRIGATREQILAVFEQDYGWRSAGCPLRPPAPGCLQFQQIDALLAELADP